MKLKSIYLKRGKEESLERFHPWVFSGAIHNADEGIEEGDVVKVITFDGQVLDDYEIITNKEGKVNKVILNIK